MRGKENNSIKHKFYRGLLKKSSSTYIITLLLLISSFTVIFTSSISSAALIKEGIDGGAASGSNPASSPPVAPLTENPSTPSPTTPPSPTPQPTLSTPSPTPPPSPPPNDDNDNDDEDDDGSQNDAGAGGMTPASGNNVDYSLPVFGNSYGLIFLFSPNFGDNQINDPTQSQGENMNTESPEYNWTIENSNETGVYAVEFTPVTNLSNVTVTVEFLDELPEEIPPPPGIIYSILDMKLLADGEYVQEYDVESLWFKYKVIITWIANNSVGNDTIRLMRYHNGTWQNLTFTDITDIDEIFMYFKSKSPGCSTFAIVGDGIIKTENKSNLPEIPWVYIGGFTIFATIALITEVPTDTCILSF